MLTQQEKDQIDADVAARKQLKDRIDADIAIIRERENRHEISAHDAYQAAHELEKEYDNSDEFQKVKHYSQQAQNDPELGKVLMDAKVKHHLNE